MRSIRFKKSSLKWILEGKKTTTFRTKRRSGLYEIVEGSLFEPTPIGVIVELTPIENIPFSEVLEKYFNTEGDFKTQNEFEEWLIDENLYDLYIDKNGWLHTVELVSNENYKDKKGEKITW